jgi:hypothetical protein
MSFAILETSVAFERLFYKHKNILASMFARLRPKDHFVVMGIAFRISFLICQDQCTYCCYVCNYNMYDCCLEPLIR